MRAIMVGVGLALGLGVLGSGGLRVQPTLAAETPERVVSWRIRCLPTEEYPKLRDQWRAYTEAHPKDPLGWTQLARAGRYAGATCEENAVNARKAVEVDPNYADAHTTLAYILWTLYCPDSGMDANGAIRELETALSLDPTDPEPYFTLWVARLSLGDVAGADEALRGLIRGNGIPEPILDFGYNLLVDLEPNAILITNGDNDTYPPLALQVARQVRPDVAVLNRSLLNTDWYRDLLRKGPLHVPLPSIVGKPTEKPETMPSTQAIRGLAAALEKDGWKRPLYIAATVPGAEELIENGLTIEGLVYRVGPVPAKESKVDLARLEANLLRNYRLESATSLAFDWDWANSVGRLTGNYLELYDRLGSGLAGSGRKAQAAEAWSKGILMAEFHHDTKWGARLAGDWLEADPASPAAAEWKRKFASATEESR